ncbi:MAG: hypothetical protein AABN95_22015 [Acidobacteriota bacterium]
MFTKHYGTGGTLGGPEEIALTPIGNRLCQKLVRHGMQKLWHLLCDLA